jgi:hypothetical protein
LFSNQEQNEDQKTPVKFYNESMQNLSTAKGFIEDNASSQKITRTRNSQNEAEAVFTRFASSKDKSIIVQETSIKESGDIASTAPLLICTDHPPRIDIHMCTKLVSQSDLMQDSPQQVDKKILNSDPSIAQEQ